VRANCFAHFGGKSAWCGIQVSTASLKSRGTLEASESARAPFKSGSWPNLRRFESKPSWNARQPAQQPVGTLRDNLLRCRFTSTEMGSSIGAQSRSFPVRECKCHLECCLELHCQKRAAAAGAAAAASLHPPPAAAGGGWHSSCFCCSASCQRQLPHASS